MSKEQCYVTVYDHEHKMVYYGLESEMPDRFEQSGYRAEYDQFGMKATIWFDEHQIPEIHMLEISEAVINVFNVQLPKMEEQLVRYDEMITKLEKDHAIACEDRRKLAAHINDVKTLVAYAEENKKVAGK